MLSRRFIYVFMVGSISLVFFGLFIFAPPSGQVRGKKFLKNSRTQAAQDDSESFVLLCS